MTQESALQSAVIKYLQYRKKDVYFIRNNSFAGRIVRPNGSTGWIQNSKKGAPDIIVLFNGIYIGLELKSQKGTTSKEQKEAQQDIERCGGYYYVIKDLSEVKEILK